MKQIEIKIKTISPVILSTRGNTNVMTATYDHFNGTVVRGIVANRYIRMNDLGDNAHENNDFLRLFFNRLRFVAAYPVNQGINTRSIVMPLSLQKIKDGNSIIDLLRQDSEPNYKSLRGFGALADGKIYLTEVRRNISLHMSRSDMRDKNGQERLAGRSKQSGIYNYESIDAGQLFTGFIIGNEEDLEKLITELKGTEWTAHIGKSHYTQYGSCHIKLGDLHDIPPMEQVSSNTVCLRLETPVLQDSLLKDNSIPDAAAALQNIAQQMNTRCHTDEFDIVTGIKKIFSKSENIDNFVGIWGMKRPRAKALAAGTIFQLKKASQWTEEDYNNLNTICYEGVGQRTAEGFGQLRVWNQPLITMADVDDISPKCLAQQAVVSKQVQEYAMNIVTKKMQEAVRIFAAEDVELSKKFFPDNYKHLFGRLDSMLGSNPSYSRSHIQDCLCNELRGEATPLFRLLHKVEIQGSTLYELLNDMAITDMPYNRRSWKETLSDDIKEALKDIDENMELEHLIKDQTLFYEYWHWFFRHGRKTKQAERWLKK